MPRYASSEITCFNEAAGIPRGRHGVCNVGAGVHLRFNEAAGIPRGRRVHSNYHYRSTNASMRPRVFPAEDAVVGNLAALVAKLQ